MAITETEVPLRERKIWLKQLGQSSRTLQRQAALAGSLVGLATIAQLALLAWVITALLINQKTFPALLPALALMLAVIVLRALAQYWQEAAANRASLGVRSLVRKQLLASWAHLGPINTAQQSAANHASQLIDQTEALDGYFARFLPQLQITLWVPLVILLLVFWLDWVAGLLLLMSAPLIPVFMALVGMGADRVNQQHFASLGRLAGQFLDRIRGLTTLQLFGQTRAAKERLGQHSDEYRLLTMKTLRIAFLSSAVLEFFAAVAIAMLAIYIGFGLLGYISWGPSVDLTLFSGLLILLLAPEFFQPLRTLAQHYHDRAAALGAAAQLAGIAVAREIRGEETITEKPADNRLELIDLHRTLPDRGELYGGLNARFEPGQLVVISGPTGSGKSTLLSLIAGFQAPDRGQLTVFGETPGKHPLAWLSQRPFLLFGSWRDNLQLLSPEASDAQMLEALSQLGLSKRVQQSPQGLDSPVGEGGGQLSGGQAQRLALARVMLSSLPLVLLDEPTAALDPDSRDTVIGLLRVLADEQRLVIAATHDPALIEIADQVIDLGGSQ
ncbi:MAG: thiol reductant ABC exporter subunit CydD [Saccharospirillum sp.]|nr:thiol reductant ABC exporter subunit CydD [Saccharospirillum sp.]